MVLAGDPLELRFKMTVGTAQVGGTYPGPRPVAGARLRLKVHQRRPVLSFQIPAF